MSGDAFFDIGGTSRRTLHLVERVRQHFGVEIGVFRMFDHPTIRSPAATEDYFEAIRAVHAPGTAMRPTGLRMGGLIAAEVARLATDSGMDVERLILLESAVPSRLRRTPVGRLQQLTRRQLSMFRRPIRSDEDRRERVLAQLVEAHNPTGPLHACPTILVPAVSTPRGPRAAACP